VLPRHLRGLVASSEVKALMRAGLDASYQRAAPREAAARLREVLTRVPTHYGATLQLAKALDAAGDASEAATVWKKMVEMANAAGDTETAGVARARLTGGR
jgi:cytochrome c-type biogenesis protein CcmH/NrfG